MLGGTASWAAGGRGCRRRRGPGRTGGRVRSRRAAAPGPAPPGRRRTRRRSGRARVGRSTRRSARPASATSLRRSPGTRRLPVVGRPTWSGVRRARRVVRNSRTSWRTSCCCPRLEPRPLRARRPSDEGCPVSTPIDRDFHRPRPAASLDVVAASRRHARRDATRARRRGAHRDASGCHVRTRGRPGRGPRGPDDHRAHRRDHPSGRDLHLRQRPVALPRRRAGRPPGDGPRVRRRRRGDRRRGPHHQGRRLRRRLVLGLRQHLRDLPGRLPGVLRAPGAHGHHRHPVRAGPHPARRRHPGRHARHARRPT